MSEETKKTARVQAGEEAVETVNEKTLMDQLDSMKTAFRGYDKEATCEWSSVDGDREEGRTPCPAPEEPETGERKGSTDHADGRASDEGGLPGIGKPADDGTAEYHAEEI